MVSIQQPLRQLRQPLRQRPSKKMTLSATDEFWLAPLEDASSTDTASTSVASAATASPAASANPGDDDGDFMEVIVLPAAHQQLLSSDPVTIEDLKGYDHKRDFYGQDNDGYASDKSSCAPKRRGSWLLGLSDSLVPGLVRVPSGASLASDECSTSSESDDDSSLASSSGKRPRGGVSFDTVVKVQPIPHSDVLSAAQRRKMYSTSLDVRQNKIRNKKEFRYDGYDWRNATEEWEMGVDMVTGELIHPVHEYSK